MERVEARHYEKLEQDGKVQCHLCPHECRISPDRVGICLVRKNIDGELIATTYGRAAAVSMDPIEKKPLYHFHPSSQILSVGSLGCTFKCPWCQNCHLVEFKASTREARPEELIEAARQHDSIGIAYTYNEPWTFYEYTYDTAKMAHDAGLKNVLVTNGYYMPEPLEEILPYIDAMNIDLKSIRPEFYKQHVGGELEPVLRTIERAATDCLVELTTLLITDENDSQEDLREETDWIASISPDIPVHFSRYRPMYKFTKPPTPEASLRRAYEIASQKLNYVYIGNVVGLGGEDTVCPHCSAVLVKRSGYMTHVQQLKDGKCTGCGENVAIVM